MSTCSRCSLIAAKRKSLVNKITFMKRHYILNTEHHKNLRLYKTINEIIIAFNFILIPRIGWVHIKQFLKDIRFDLVFEEKNYLLVKQD